MARRAVNYPDPMILFCVKMTMTICLQLVRIPVIVTIIHVKSYFKALGQLQIETCQVIKCATAS